MILCQWAFTQSVINKAVERAAAAWNNPDKNIDTGSVSQDSLSSGGLYWRLIDFNKNEKIENIESYIKAAGTFIKPVKRQVDVEIKDFVVSKKLVVNLVDSYSIPIPSVARLLGANDYYNIRYQTEAVINEPPEFIRNVDLLVDVTKFGDTKYKGLQGSKDKLKNLGQGVNDVFSKLLRKRGK